MKRESQYLIDYLNLAWDTDLRKGLDAWLAAFQDALDSRDDKLCQALLQNLKSAPHSREVEELSRYVEARWRELRGEYLRARALYREVLALVQASGAQERKARVMVDLAEVEREMGYAETAVHLLQQVLTFYGSAEQPSVLVGVLNQTAAAYTELGEWERAEEYVNEGLRLADSSADRAALLSTKGMLHFSRANYTLARYSFQSALDVYQQLGIHSAIVRLLNNLALVALKERQVEAARNHLLEALTLARQVEDWLGTARTLGNFALIAEDEGELRQAVVRCTEAIESIREIGDLRAEALFLNLRGTFFIDLRALEEARADHERSRDLARQIDDPVAEVAALNNLGTAFRYLERLDEAATCYQEALEGAERLGDRAQMGEVLGNLGHLLALEGDNKGAETNYQRSLAIARDVRDAEMEAASLIGLAGIAFAEMDFDRLARLLKEGWEVGEKSRQVDVLARLDWFYGDLALLKGDIETGSAVYAEAATFAAEAGGVLLEATLERLTLHRNYLSPDAFQKLSTSFVASLSADVRSLYTEWMDEESAY